MKKIIPFLLLAAPLWAAEYEVQMLDMNDSKQTMVFEPGFLKVAPGDTVKFVPTHKSHYVEAKVVPEGAEKFKSELDQEFSVKLEKEGVYFYVCPPHNLMNMVGVIQVGAPVNLAEVKERAAKFDKRATANKGRALQLVEQMGQADGAGAQADAKSEALPTEAPAAEAKSEAQAAEAKSEAQAAEAKSEAKTEATPAAEKK